MQLWPAIDPLKKRNTPNLSLQAQRSATTDTCYARKLPYLVCCPKGTEDVLEASSNDITSALLKN